MIAKFKQQGKSCYEAKEKAAHGKKSLELHFKEINCNQSPKTVKSNERKVESILSKEIWSDDDKFGSISYFPYY